MTAWYNENDPFAAAWLRALISAGAIAPGDVDERDVRDVRPADLDGYTQCHFFAGIGTWSYALRRAGWPDDLPVWTGSCPCQPFSAAGKRGGTADERHLWPAWFHLIDQRRPAIVFGEQVASRDGLAWLDLVQADLEGAAYACGALDSCSACVGAPHIRQRLWLFAEYQRRVADEVARWLGDTRLARLEGHAGNGDRGDQPGWLSAAPTRPSAEAGGARRVEHDESYGRIERGTQSGWRSFAERRLAGGLANGAASRWQGQLGRLGGADRRSAQEPGRLRDAGGLALADARGRTLVAPWRIHGHRSPRHDADRRGELCRVGHPGSVGRSARGFGHHAGDERDLAAPAERAGRPGPVNGLWAAADWLFCRDGRWRPVEPETFPLAHGVTARVGRLRGYGNAINAEAAAVFVAQAIECLRLRGERA